MRSGLWHQRQRRLPRPDDHRGHLERYGEQAQREGTTVAALQKAADERTVLKHVVTATDIGCFVAMLCSPLAIGVHGEAIGIDGGNRADMHY